VGSKLDTGYVKTKAEHPNLSSSLGDSRNQHNGRRSLIVSVSFVGIACEMGDHLLTRRKKGETGLFLWEEKEGRVFGCLSTREKSRKASAQIARS